MSIFNFFKKDNKQVAENKQEEPTAPETQTSNTKTKEESQPAAPRTIIPETQTSNAKTEEESHPAEARTIIPEQAKRVHNLIILDESGSMQSIYRPTLTGVNETLQTIREAQKEHEGQEHYVTLVAFDTGHYDKIYSNTPAANAVDITENQYHPCGGTPLYDAMGRSIHELNRNVAKEDYVLVTVITDGYENASREYNGKAIKSLIEAKKQEGWVFTYIGANQDVEAVAASMSIDNRLAFEANEMSTKAMFMREKKARQRFFGHVDSNKSKHDLLSDYFDE